MRRLSALAMAAGLLAACHPTAQDSQAPAATAAGHGDAPADPTEPASAPAAPQAAVNADFLGPIQAAGTEPFWALTVSHEELVFTRPDHDAVRVPNPGPRMEGKSVVWAAPHGALELTLTPGHCSDGMSDRDYPYTAVVVADGQTLSGCARPGIAPG
jgi:uncharacterized membrane protein